MVNIMSRSTKIHCNRVLLHYSHESAENHTHIKTLDLEDNVRSCVLWPRDIEVQKNNLAI